MDADLQCLLAACRGELDKLAPKPVAYFVRFIGTDSDLRAVFEGVYGHPTIGSTEGIVGASRVHGISRDSDGLVTEVETKNTVYRRVPR